MIGKITTTIALFLIFLFVFIKVTLADCSCDSYGQNCNCPHRYIMVYVVDQNGTRWVEGNDGSGNLDQSPCTGGVQVLTPADGSQYVFTRTSLPTINNVMEDGFVSERCSGDSGDRDYRGGWALQSYRIGDDPMPPPPRRYIFRFHPPAGYDCSQVVWEKRDDDRYNPNAPLEHVGYGCVIDTNLNYEDDWEYHVIVRMSNVPTLTPTPACPNTFGVTCDFTNSSVTLNWNNVGAAEYAIRANADPFLDWYSASGGDKWGMASSTNITFNAIKQDTLYAWYVEPKTQVGTPNDPTRACMAGLFTCTVPTQPPPLPCPASFSYTCNADGTLATLDWSDVAGAAEYTTRFDAVPNNDWYNAAGGDMYRNGITTSTSTIPVTPNRTYLWSVESKRASSDPNNYDNRCIAGNLTCVPQLTNVSLQLRGVSAVVNTSIKGSGLRSSNTTPPEVGTDLNNPVRATITTNGTSGSTGVLGVAFTPSSNSCTELENPATGVTPRPTGVIRRILATDGNSDFINKGIFIAYAQNNIANFYGKAMTQGRFYVHYNDAWIASYGTASTSLNVPSAANSAFTVRLNSATFTGASGNVQFDISFNKALGSQLWYSRAYGANSTLSIESTTQCITPGDPNEGNSY